MGEALAEIRRNGTAWYTLGVEEYEHIDWVG